jgi:hypothetical protein
MKEERRMRKADEPGNDFAFSLEERIERRKSD